MPPTLDNPAGRLHALLSNFRARADPSKSLLSVWAEVLEADGADLPLAQCEAASVLVDLRRVVDELDRPEITEVVDQYYGSWAESLLLRRSPSNQTPSAGVDAVDLQALLALGMVSALLSLNFTDAQVPTSEQVSSLRVQIQGALDALRDDQALSENLKVAMLARLTDLLWALDRLTIGGPEAVSAATERLLGALVMFQADPGKSTSLGLVMTVARFAWSAFTKAPQALEALEAWHKVAAALPPGPTG